MAKSSPVPKAQQPVPQFGDRLRFAIWLSAKTLGVDSAKELAEVLGKRQGQLSDWLNETPRPQFENIKLIAETVGVSAAWLDDPASRDATQPNEWPEWWASRVKRRAGTAQAQRRRA